MSVVELQKYTAISKYARWLEEDKRREVWGETVARYQDMLVQKYPNRETRIREVCCSIQNYEVLPSMRALQFGGKPALQHSARTYNCCASYCDRLRFFQESYYLLLCGCGTGLSVQDRHLSSLPRFSKRRSKGVRLPKKVFCPNDSIEGWSDCAAVLMSSYHEVPVKGFEDYHECDVQFDYSSIREKGSKLSFGIGKAPGPGPLHNANERVRLVLNKAIAEGLTKLNSLYAYDAVMHWSDSVLAGGVRRSATIVLFDLWDQAMLMAKTGNWMATNPQRGRSNNSAVLVRGQVSFEQFDKLFEATKQFGEPGFFWVDHPDSLANPCLEVGLWGYLEVSKDDPDLGRILASYEGPKQYQQGKVVLSGWEFCNLTTINGKTVCSEDDFYNRCKHAAELGTWQAGFDSFPYLGEVTDQIVRREALLGVSISGIMHHPDLLLNAKVLRTGANVVKEANEREAYKIGIKPAARLTCVKPDGNSASLLGSFSGCHPGKFRKGFRIVQANKQESPYRHFRSVNPEACEPSVWNLNETDDIIRFCVNYDGLMEENMTAVEMLDCVKTIYANWVCAGRIPERCTRPWLSHSVSNTIRVSPKEWDKVARHIYDNQDYYAGVSLIGSYGDRDYPQAPFTGVYDQYDREKVYGVEAVARASEIVDAASCVFANLWEASDLALDGWDFSRRKPNTEQLVWVEKVRSYAAEYFDGDVRRATYCLKDHFNWHLYVRLKLSYKPVNYKDMVEENNGVNLQGEISCAGGVCSV